MSIDNYIDFAKEAYEQHKKFSIFVKILFYLLVISSNILFVIYKLTYFYVFLWISLLYLTPSLLILIKSKKIAKLMQSFIIFFVTLQSIGIVFCFGTIRDDVCESVFTQYEVHSVKQYDSDGDEIEGEIFETGYVFFDALLILLTDYSFILVLLIYVGGMPLHHILYNRINSEKNLLREKNDIHNNPQ